MNNYGPTSIQRHVEVAMSQTASWKDEAQSDTTNREGAGRRLGTTDFLHHHLSIVVSYCLPYDRSCTMIPPLAFCFHFLALLRWGRVIGEKERSNTTAFWLIASSILWRKSFIAFSRRIPNFDFVSGIVHERIVQRNDKHLLHI